MTNEERANEYTNSINTIIYDIEDNAINIAKYLRKAYLDGLAEGRKEKWHDLRKSPDDLPKENKQYLVAYRNFQNPEETVTECLEWLGSRFVDENYEDIPWFAHKDVLVAWCEIPKFEE